MLRTKRLAREEGPGEAPALEAAFHFTAADVEVLLLGADALAGDPYTRLPTECSLHQTLSGIFSTFSMDVYAEPENDFDFRGVSSISSISTYSEQAGEDAACRTVVSTINLQHLDAAAAAPRDVVPGVPQYQAVRRLAGRGGGPGEDEAYHQTVYRYLLILRSYLRRYAEAIYPSVSANLKRCTDPLEINRQFVIITSFWNDFRGKLAMCVSVFDEMDVDQAAVRAMFHYCLMNDIFSPEVIRTISQLLCTALSLKQLRAPHPRLVLIRRVFGIFCAAVAQEVDPMLASALPPGAAGPADSGAGSLGAGSVGSAAGPSAGSPPALAGSGSFGTTSRSGAETPLSVVRIPAGPQTYLQDFFSNLSEALKIQLTSVSENCSLELVGLAFTVFFELNKITELSTFCLQREAGEDVPSRCERFLLTKDASALRGYRRDPACVAISPECRAVLRAEPQLRDLRCELLEMVFSFVLRAATVGSGLLVDCEARKPAIELLYAAAVELDTYTGSTSFIPGEERPGKGLRGVAKSGSRQAGAGYRHQLFREIAGAVERSARAYLFSPALLDGYTALPRPQRAAALAAAPLTHVVGLNLVELYLRAIDLYETLEGSNLFLSMVVSAFTAVLYDAPLYDGARKAAQARGRRPGPAAQEEQREVFGLRAASCVLSLMDALMRYACLLQLRAACNPSFSPGELSLATEDPVFAVPLLVISRALPDSVEGRSAGPGGVVPPGPPATLAYMEARVMAWLEVAGKLLGRFSRKEMLVDVMFKLSFNRLIAFPTSDSLLLFEQQAYRAVTHFLSRQLASQVYAFLLQLDCSHTVTCQSNMTFGRARECVLVTTPFYREHAHLQSLPELAPEELSPGRGRGSEKPAHLAKTPESRRRVWMDLIQRFGNYSTSSAETVFEQAAPVDLAVFRLGGALVLATYELQEVVSRVAQARKGLSKKQVAEIITQCRKASPAVPSEAVGDAVAAVKDDVEELYEAALSGRAAPLAVSGEQLVLADSAGQESRHHVLLAGSLVLNVCRDVYWPLGGAGEAPAWSGAGPDGSPEGGDARDLASGASLPGSELVAGVSPVGDASPAALGARSGNSGPGQTPVETPSQGRLHDSLTAGMLLNSFLVQTVKGRGKMSVSDLISEAMTQYRFVQEDGITRQMVRIRIERLVDLGHLALSGNLLIFELSG